jgi:hypothetical protein
VVSSSQYAEIRIPTQCFKCHWPASNEALALPFTVFEGPSVLAGISAGQPVAAATAVIINDWFHNVAMQHES